MPSHVQWSTMSLEVAKLHDDLLSVWFSPHCLFGIFMPVGAQARGWSVSNPMSAWDERPNCSTTTSAPWWSQVSTASIDVFRFGDWSQSIIRVPIVQVQLGPPAVWEPQVFSMTLEAGMSATVLSLSI